MKPSTGKASPFDTDERATILIVDDTPANISVLLSFLENNEFNVMVAEDGLAAIESIKFSNPDLILLDIMMPHLDGFETCKRLKENPETNPIPVMFMTALHQTSDKVKGLDLGAVDFISKPFQNEEVLARIRTQLSLVKTQREFLEKELEVKTIQAMDASRKDFLELITGELKSPVMAIHGNSLILKESLLGTEHAEFVSTILENCSKLEKFSTCILDFLKESSKLEGVRQNRIQIEPLLRFVANSNKKEADEKKIKILTDCHPKVPTNLSGNPINFRKILDELVKNAIHFSESCKIFILVDAIECPQKFQSDPRKWKLTIKVRDEGIGIPDENLTRIFSPFYQIDTNAKDRGIGLGLPLVKKLCNLMNAQIKVESQVGVGSEFVIETEIPE
jgi:signal transduction histidine kinase